MSFYFIGIGGVSMSALAKLLHGEGFSVRGSDDAEGEFTRELRALGVPVSIGRAEEIAEDTVVYTGAVEETHPQLLAAKRAGKRLVRRADFLGELAASYPAVCSVAGCHGKTTTTCMLAHIFRGAGKRFTAHVGGEDLDLGNCYSGGRDFFLTEACEFQRSFLSIRSTAAVILNCDYDHSDCYPSEEDLFAAYRAFAEQAEEVIVCADDPRARTLPHALSFGIFEGDVRAEHLASLGEQYAFTVTEGGVPVVRIRLHAVGRVHIYNALAAYAAARRFGISGEDIRRGLENFHGVRRRFERVGSLFSCPVICDYAHHPREIAATLRAAEKLTAGTVRVVFQPHTYTRTRDLMGDFVEVLKDCEAPILYETYAAREKYDFAGSAARLLSLLPEARYAASPSHLLRLIGEKAEAGDLILVLGAGDIYAIMRSLTAREDP